MKRLFLAILILSCQKGLSQISVSEMEKLLSQSDLNFGIGWTSVMNRKPDQPIFTMFVKIEDSIKSNIRKLCKEQWQVLLKNEKIQWNVNLLLYEVYQISASVFFVAKNRELWQKTFKDADLEYWNEYFLNQDL